MSKLENTFTWGKSKGCTCDLTNYYTKNEVDNKDEVINQNIETLTQQTNNNTNSINTIETQQQQQDKLILANSENIVKVNSNIQDLRAEYMDLNNALIENGTNITINATAIERIDEKIQTMDNKISSVIKFYKYEIRMFESKQVFLDTIATPLNLQENIDFETIEPSRYLLTGTTNIVGGSNYITENNLPKKEWGFDISDHYGRYGGYNYMLSPSESNNITIKSLTQSAAGDISYSGGSSIERRQFRWSYGNEYSNEFLPKFQMVYCVKFLKNIK